MVLDEMMLFEEPSEGRATAAGDRRKAESIQRKAGKRHGSSAASHQLRPALQCSGYLVTNRIDVYAIINDCLYI